MNCRDRSLYEFSDCAGSTEGVDDFVGVGLHDNLYAIIGSISQAETSDNRDCDIRNLVSNGSMSNMPTMRPEAAEIFARLDALGIKQRELAMALGLEENKVSKVKAGERQFRGTELLRARDWLTDREREAGISETSDHVVTLKSEEGAIPLRHINLSLAMGEALSFDDYYEEGVFEFDAGLLRDISHAPAHRLVVGQGVGDSMMPTIHDDATVIFDTTQKVLNSDDKIWAISLFGAGSIKRLQVIAKDRVLVVSDNPIVPNKEVSTDDLRILGRVVWSARRH